MSSRMQKRKNVLKAYAKKRARRPEPRTQTIELGIKQGPEQNIIHNHTGVLQNIESAILDASKSSDEIDDSVVAEILRCSIRRQSSEDPVVRWATDYIAELRDARSDVSDELWQNALRVVYKSLKRHSDCQPGDVDYLAFISNFLH